MTSWLVRNLAFAASCLLGSSALAADIYSPMTPQAREITTESGWTFSFAPYFWAAGLSGDIGQFGLSAVDVDASFSDVFDHLDFALMATAEARNGPYSIFGDAIYIKLSGQGATPRGFLADDVELATETFAGLLGPVTRFTMMAPLGSTLSAACACGPSRASSPSAVALSVHGREPTMRPGWTGWQVFAAPTRSLRKSI